MPDSLIVVLIFLIGIIGGFVDSTLSAGGLITIPFLIFLGLPPQVAIATDRLGGIGERITVFFKFRNAKKIVWEYVPILTFVSIIASIIGANILINIDPALLEKIIGILLIILPVFLLKSHIGIQRAKISTVKKIFGLFFYFLAMIYGSIFAQGAGIFITYTLIYFFGLSIIEVSATTVIPSFFLSVFSLIIFAHNGIIDYKKGLILLIGMAIGGYIGAHTVIKKGDKWLKRLFIGFVVFSSIKLLFNSFI